MVYTVHRRGENEEGIELSFFEVSNSLCFVWMTKLMLSPRILLFKGPTNQGYATMERTIFWRITLNFIRTHEFRFWKKNRRINRRSITVGTQGFENYGSNWCQKKIRIENIGAVRKLDNSEIISPHGESCFNKNRETFLAGGPRSTVRDRAETLFYHGPRSHSLTRCRQFYGRQFALFSSSKVNFHDVTLGHTNKNCLILFLENITAFRNIFLMSRTDILWYVLVEYGIISYSAQSWFKKKKKVMWKF